MVLFEVTGLAGPPKQVSCLEWRIKDEKESAKELSLWGRQRMGEGGDRRERTEGRRELANV